MKQCLECKKDFESKSHTAKFCSVGCRVKNHRRVSIGKKGISLTQLQVVYNSILDLVSNHKNEPLEFAAVETKSIVATRPKLRKSLGYFQREIANGFDTPEMHKAFVDDVNASDLQKREKDLLIMSSRTIQN